MRRGRRIYASWAPESMRAELERVGAALFAVLAWAVVLALLVG